MALYLLCTFQHLLFSRHVKTREDRQTHMHTTTTVLPPGGSAHCGIKSLKLCEDAESLPPDCYEVEHLVVSRSGFKVYCSVDSVNP